MILHDIMLTKTFETLLDITTIELVSSFMKFLVPKDLKADVKLRMLIISYFTQYLKKTKKIQFPLFLTVNDYPSKICLRCVSSGNAFLWIKKNRFQLLTLYNMLKHSLSCKFLRNLYEK